MEIGLKVWSINLDYLESINYIVANRLCDYIELYVVPGTIKYIDFWKQFNIKYVLHAPTTLHGLNPADGMIDKNLKIYSEVLDFAKELFPAHIIIHGGMGGELRHSMEFFSLIDTSIVVVENMPFLSLDDRICIGYSYEQLKLIIDKCGTGFCFDIGHAIKYASYGKIDPYDVLKELQQLSPLLYHISDGHYDNPYDEHLSIGEGDFDFRRIFEILDKNKLLTLETPKESSLFHTSFIHDRESLNKFF